MGTTWFFRVDHVKANSGNLGIGAPHRDLWRGIPRPWWAQRFDLIFGFFDVRVILKRHVTKIENYNTVQEAVPGPVRFMEG